MITAYERRTEREWQLLRDLAVANSELVHVGRRTVTGNGAEFSLILLRTAALIGRPNELRVHLSHEVALHLPRFFPSVPIEANLVQPVFHPNIHPETGFICLWRSPHANATVIEALAQIQRVLSWELFNRESDHVMQPEALVWFDDPGTGVAVPLPYEPLHVPEGYTFSRTCRVAPQGFRRRLSS